MKNIFLKLFFKVIMVLCIFSILSLSVSAQNPKKKLTDLIFKDNQKEFLRTESFDILINLWQDEKYGELTKKIVKLDKYIAYGILKFGKSTRNRPSKTFKTEYNNSVWILVYTPEFHTNYMLVLVDLEKDGYFFDGGDQTIDEIYYVTDTLLKKVDNLRSSPKSVEFSINLDSQNPNSSTKNYRLSHGDILEGDYAKHYANAVNCVNIPYDFVAFNASQLIALRGECPEFTKLPPGFLANSNSIVLGNDFTNNDPFVSEQFGKLNQTNELSSTNQVEKKKIEFSLYEKIVCSGIGSIGHKCVIYPPNEWYQLTEPIIKPTQVDPIQLKPTQLESITRKP